MQIFIQELIVKTEHDWDERNETCLIDLSRRIVLRLWIYDNFWVETLLQRIERALSHTFVAFLFMLIRRITFNLVMSTIRSATIKKMLSFHDWYISSNVRVIHDRINVVYKQH